MPVPSSAAPSRAEFTRLDVDGLLTRYRTGRAQAALFDPRGGPGLGYDEFVDAAGNVRPAWTDLAEALARRGLSGLDRLRDEVRTLVDNDGITYTRPTGVPAPWRLDPIPLLLTAEDWQALEAGLVQRSRLLDAVLTDLYGPKLSLTSGILPPALVFGHPGYLRAAHGIEVPGRHQLFLHGCDVSRGGDGFVVNADWAQAPSGAGYAMADRRVVASAISELYEQLAPRAVSQFAQTLRSALIEAAPEAAEDPAVVVLSPGIHSETAFDQAYLASALGFPLVESADLVVRGGKLWMRSLGTFQRVDVVLRRVDAAYSDPLDLRPDSRLGVVGLVEAQRRGAVTVVNTLGSGILESPALLRFLPQLAELLIGEAPMLPTVATYWGGIDTERSHLLSRLGSLLIRSTVGGPDHVGPELSSAQLAELSARIAAAPWQWIGQELPQYSSAPTVGPGRLVPANVAMRLFTVSQRGGYAPMIGGLGYVVAPNGVGHRLNVGAAKDIWVLPSASAAAEQPAAAPTMISVGVAELGAVSSPRVLSDLFWSGRYAERAEAMARLLTVTRERYHEYRHRQYTEASECVPVLLTALGELTGADDGAADATEMIATAPSTLWSLTADRDRPGSLAQSVERLGLAARSVRDQLSNDTWMVLAAVDHAVLELPTAAPETHSLADTKMAAAHARTLAGMLALSGVAAESMVQDAGWTMMDIGKRIERGLALAGLLRATMTTERGREAARVITESVLTACESAVIYRRRNLGKVSVAAVADLLLFDAGNPRSLVYQLELLRTRLRALPGATGSTRAERLVDELNARLRRMAPEELERADEHGVLVGLRGLLDGVLAGLRELSDLIAATHLSLPGGMQPLWGPDQRRQMP
ncbi:circularly permuted type 2 ATP-grasp protein [[Mycobacterium] wendilense]|uniref:Circularly permuted type 2 ATP-grasp protein n=1 Tax=[Mycobacterium] wendilense TaxID=3064284 RepID=A0ABM9MER3_9MYCO|nr:circularly permuted type 2 ATP-grasp protein [Mycolicibacterium sp. MU0050]CAJ1583448.1 circularly permuted type 2 ATP-grasp protein [Mycolicibacterium sp. MU0050]